MKSKTFAAGRRSVVAMIASALVFGLTGQVAHAANYWALRHDGPVPANQGAWNDLFVCAASAGSAPLIANRTSVGEWEKFDFILFGGAEIALQAKINNKYVTRQSDGRLQATSTTLGAAQHFTIDTSGLSGGHFRLVHISSGKYVRLDASGVLWADGTNPANAANFLQWAF